MNPTHFFTLGYYPEYMLTGIIIGIVIGIYAFFRVRYALNDSKLSKNKVMIISAPISIFAFICCLNNGQMLQYTHYTSFYARYLQTSLD